MCAGDEWIDHQSLLIPMIVFVFIVFNAAIELDTGRIAKIWKGTFAFNRLVNLAYLFFLRRLPWRNMCIEATDELDFDSEMSLQVIYIKN